MELSTQIEKIKPEPGDTLVFRLPNRANSDAVRRIRDFCVRDYPGVKVMVLDVGVELRLRKRSEPGERWDLHAQHWFGLHKEQPVKECNICHPEGDAT